MLEVAALQAGYGQSQVLYEVSFAVGEGEVVTLLGRNGMGKTTTIKSIMGLVPALGGTVSLAGSRLTGRPPFRIAQTGIGLVPEGRQIFPTLTAEENLIATAANRIGHPKPWTLETVYALLPRLAERRNHMGHQLSGGEQQMVAIARALMTNPRLLILDEATEGLAPLIRQEIWNCLETLKAQGQSILLVDKNLKALNRFADRHVILEKGHVVWTGTSAELSTDAGVTNRYLTV